MAANKVLSNHVFFHCHLTNGSDNLEIVAPLFRIRDDSHQQ